MQRLTGRVLRKRDCGKIIFLTVRAQEQELQIAGTPETEKFEQLKRLPIGSILQFWGAWGKTNRNTPTFFLARYECQLEPRVQLPDKHSGLKQCDRHRRRVLDLLTNVAAFDVARTNADILRGLRDVLAAEGYREFNTGVLQPIFEGGLAKPFETKLRATQSVLYLSLTSELKLKRLIAAGFERVSEITQSFRNEGLGRFHSPEFSLLEAYGVDQSLEDMCSLAEKLLLRGSQVAGVPLQKPRVLTFEDAYREFVDSSEPMSLRRLQILHPDKFVKGMPFFTWVMKVLEILIGPHLSDPTFVTELPSGLSPLVKKSVHNPLTTERAFLFCKGLFIADLYVDENDPKILEGEFLRQAAAYGTSVNQEYLEIIRIGIPRTAGVGLGVNRLQMLFLPTTLPYHIRETILYPLG